MKNLFFNKKNGNKSHKNLETLKCDKNIITLSEVHLISIKGGDNEEETILKELD